MGLLWDASGVVRSWMLVGVECVCVCVLGPGQHPQLGWMGGAHNVTHPIHQFGDGWTVVTPPPLPHTHTHTHSRPTYTTLPTNPKQGTSVPANQRRASPAAGGVEAALQLEMIRSVDN